MYAIVCFDRPDSAALRDQHRAAHMEFLKTHSGKIVFGGPLKNTAGRAEHRRADRGRLRDAQGSRGFIAADPFYRGGVYESVAVRAFKQVFPQK